MWFPSRAVVEQIRKTYPAGTRVELIYMNDPYNKTLKSGSKGTVSFVDDAGTIHVNWDNGSTLGLCFEVDKFKVI